MGEAIRRPSPSAQSLYPIVLDLADRPVLVVGLGPVGRRKAEGLLAAGARVLAVDAGIAEPPAGITLVREPYRPDHLRGVALAFAAATADVNRQVVADAQALGIWVNAATEPDTGDFLVPAFWRDGPIGLSVTTSGASPALAAALRDRAALAIGPGAAILAKVLLELRAEIMATITDPVHRHRIFTAWDDPRWLDLAEREGADAVRAILRSLIA